MTGFIGITPSAVKQARYADRRHAWTEEVGAQIAAWLVERAEWLRAAQVDPADPDAVVEHMRQMQEETPE